jgi:hypothetical protein
MKIDEHENSTLEISHPSTRIAVFELHYPGEPEAATAARGARNASAA